MAILDKIKKTLKSEEEGSPVKSEKKSAKTVKSEKRTPSTLFHGIVKNPRITEKASLLQSKNQYVFEVDLKACKPEIKKAIENIFKVHVVKINTINVLGKQVRVGRHEGKSADFKKAIITLMEGEKIDVGV